MRLFEAAEAIREHADDSRRLPVQVDGLAHNGWIGAKPPLPEAITQYDDRGCVRRIIAAGLKCAPQRSGFTQLGKIIYSHKCVADGLDIVVQSHRRSTHRPNHRRESLRVIAVKG